MSDGSITARDPYGWPSRRLISLFVLLITASACEPSDLQRTGDLSSVSGAEVSIAGELAGVGSTGGLSLIHI